MNEWMSASRDGVHKSAGFDAAMEAVRVDHVDPAATRECDGYPGLVGGNTPEGVEAQIARLERLAAVRGPCCGDPGDCSECGPSRANVGDE